MRFKIDTSEKYHVITIQERIFSANMTEEAQDLLLPFLQNQVKNLILKLQDIEIVEDAAAVILINIQQTFHDNQASFILCNMSPAVQNQLDESGNLEFLNVVPTESEAWDIVQMEEIERELQEEEGEEI